MKMTELEDRLTASGRRREPKPERTIPPALNEFLPGVRVSAWDASLNNIAFTELMATGSEILVRSKGTIRPQTELTGYLGTWDKALQLRGTLRTGPCAFLIAAADRVVVEAPSVGGGYRTESSLIAGMRVYEIAPDKTYAVVATHVSWVLTGQARLESHERKVAVKQALAQLIPGSDGRKWNEHERDAAAAGLTHLWDLSQAAETMDLVTTADVRRRLA